MSGSSMPRRRVVFLSALLIFVGSAPAIAQTASTHSGASCSGSAMRTAASRCCFPALTPQRSLSRILPANATGTICRFA
jgi:hypothetical protein